MKENLKALPVDFRAILESRWVRLLAVCVSIGMIAAVAVPVASQFSRPLIVVKHAPQTYSRRAEFFTANVTGTLADGVKALEWKVNGGPWKPVGHSKRTPRPGFTIEIPAVLLNPGLNELELRASAFLRQTESKRISFNYDPSPVQLPERVMWSAESDLDVQDGHWEVLADGRLRPVSGQEGFDRTVAVTGAIDGGRRVETEVIFRGPRGNERYGFGIFPLWGGQPDEADVSPRRGWRFSLLWYSNGTWGYGCEFSEKVGAGTPRWVSIYKGIELQRDTPYRLITETWPEQAADGRHVRWRQRCKWWPAAESEPTQWTSISDDLGAPLPPIPYAVAIFAHHSQVEFGPVTVKPLPAVTVDSNMDRSE